MSNKGSITTCDYLDFDATLNKSLKLLKSDNRNFKIGFLAICGIHFGLRISDLLNLKHADLADDTIQLIEQKTGKSRIIKINETVKNAYQIYLERIGKINADHFLFISQKKSKFTIRQVNRLLQTTFGSKNKNISSHSLRKTFSRRVWENDKYSER